MCLGISNFLLTKVCLVKAMVFPVVTYWCESWTIMKEEHWRNDAFELWCWRRLIRVPWTARRSNQSILKEIYPEYSLEGLMLKLKLQSFGHLMPRADSLEKTLMLGKTEGRGRRGQQRMRWFDGHELSYASSGRWGTGRPGVCSPWGHKESDTTEQLNNNKFWEWVEWVENKEVTKGMSLLTCFHHTWTQSSLGACLENSLYYQSTG